MGSKCCKCNTADKIYSDGVAEEAAYRKSGLLNHKDPRPPAVPTPVRPFRRMGTSPPDFLRELSDLAVKVGTRTRFLVEIRSSSTLKVSWYYNETKVVESERLSIVNEGNFYCVDVSPVMPEDEGRWTCVAENLSGRSTCSSHLKVLIPRAYKSPEFVQGLRAILTEAGTVSLECKVVGIPTPILRWFKDEKEIKAGDIFALTASASDPTSLGTYTCEALNCMGRSVSSSRVHVQNKNMPVIIQELTDHKARVGEIHTLSVQLIPPYPAKIEWYNKGLLVPSSDSKILSFTPEDGTASLCLSPLDLADEGEWKVVVVNEEGLCSTTSCQLSIVIPKNYRKPRFLENLKAILTEEGLVSFECKVVGFPTPQLYWFKDGHELRPGDVYQLSGTNSLGVYSCLAKNCMGSAESNAELTLEDIQHQLSDEEKKQLLDKTVRPPKFTRGLKSTEGKLSERLRLTVESTEQITTTWYRDNDIVLESEKYRMSCEPLGRYHLDIETLELVDEAEWKCLGVNEYGHSMTSCRVAVIVPDHYRKPKFLEPLRAVLSTEGTVNLECKVIGVPQPSLKWYKDGVELKAGDIHKIISGEGGSCCLGTYTCSAFNCMGSVSSSASLLGFEEKQAEKKVDEPKFDFEPLSTIAEERSSQMISIYETPLSDKSISLSIDGREVSLSLYETPDLTENDAKQIVEMFASQYSEHVTEQNVLSLPSLRFQRETSTAGGIVMEAVVIDVTSMGELGSAKSSDITENDFDDLSEELEALKRPLVVQENEELFDLASLSEDSEAFDVAEVRDSSLATPLVLEELQLQNLPLDNTEPDIPYTTTGPLARHDPDFYDYAGESMASYQLFPLQKQGVQEFQDLGSLGDHDPVEYERMVSSIVEAEGIKGTEVSHLSTVESLPASEERSAAVGDLTVLQRQAQIIQLQQHLSGLGRGWGAEEPEYGTQADVVASELWPLVPSTVQVEEGVETLSDIESLGTFGMETEQAAFLSSTVPGSITEVLVHESMGPASVSVDLPPSESDSLNTSLFRETVIEGPEELVESYNGTSMEVLKGSKMESTAMELTEVTASDQAKTSILNGASKADTDEAELQNSAFSQATTLETAGQRALQKVTPSKGQIHEQTEIIFGEPLAVQKAEQRISKAESQEKSLQGVITEELTPALPLSEAVTERKAKPPSIDTAESIGVETKLGQHVAESASPKTGKQEIKPSQTTDLTTKELKPEQSQAASATGTITKQAARDAAAKKSQIESRVGFQELDVSKETDIISDESATASGEVTPLQVESSSKFQFGDLERETDLLSDSEPEGFEAADGKQEKVKISNQILKSAAVEQDTLSGGKSEDLHLKGVQTEQAEELLSSEELLRRAKTSLKTGTQGTAEASSTLISEELEMQRAVVGEVQEIQDSLGKAKVSKTQILKAGTLKTAQDLSTMTEEALEKLQILVAEAEEIQEILEKPKPSKAEIYKASTFGTAEDLSTLKPEAVKKLQIAVTEAQEIQIALGTVSSPKAQILKAGTSQTLEDLRAMTPDALEKLQAAVVEATESHGALGKAKVSKAQILKAGTLKTAQDLSTMTPEALEKLKILVAEAEEIQDTLDKPKPSKAQILKAGTFGTSEDLSTLKPEAVKKLQIAVAEAQEIQLALGIASSSKAQILKSGTSQTLEDLSGMTPEALENLQIAVVEATESPDTRGKATASKEQILKAGTVKTAQDLSTMTPEALKKLQLLVAEAQQTQETLGKAKPSKAQVLTAGALKTAQGSITPESLEKLQIAVAEAQEIHVALGKASSSKAQILKAGTTQTLEDLSTMTPEALEKLHIALVEANESQGALGKAQVSKAQVLKAGTLKTAQDLSTMTPDALENLQTLVAEAQEIQETISKANLSKAQILRAGTLGTAEDLSTLTPEAMKKLQIVVAEAQQIQVAIGKANPLKAQILNAGSSHTADDLKTITPELLEKLQIAVAEAHEVQDALGQATPSKAQGLNAGALGTCENLSTIIPDQLEMQRALTTKAQDVQESLETANLSMAKVLKCGTLETAQDLSTMTPEALEKLQIVVAEAQRIQETLDKVTHSESQVLKTGALETTEVLERLQVAVAEAQEIQFALGKAKPSKAQILKAGTLGISEDSSVLTPDELEMQSALTAKAHEVQESLGKVNLSMAQVFRTGTQETAQDLSTMTPEVLENLQILVAEAQEIQETIDKVTPSKAQVLKAEALDTVQDLSTMTPEVLEKLQIAVAEAQTIHVALGKATKVLVADGTGKADSSKAQVLKAGSEKSEEAEANEAGTLEELKTERAKVAGRQDVIATNTVKDKAKPSKGAQVLKAGVLQEAEDTDAVGQLDSTSTVEALEAAECLEPNSAGIADSSKAQVLKSARAQASTENIEGLQQAEVEQEVLLSSDALSKLSKPQPSTPGIIQTSENLATMTPEESRIAKVKSTEAPENAALSKGQAPKAASPQQVPDSGFSDDLKIQQGEALKGKQSLGGDEVAETQVLKSGLGKQQTSEDSSQLTVKSETDAGEVKAAKGQAVLESGDSAKVSKPLVQKAGSLQTAEDSGVSTLEELATGQGKPLEAVEVMEVENGATGKPKQLPKAQVSKAGNAGTLTDKADASGDLKTSETEGQVARTGLESDEPAKAVQSKAKAQVLKAGSLKTAQDLSTMTPEALEMLQTLVAEAEEIQETFGKAKPSKAQVLKAGALENSQDLMTAEVLEKLHIAVAEAQEIQVALGKANPAKSQILKAGTTQTAEDLRSMTAEALETLQIAVIEAHEAQDILGKAKASKAQILKAGTLKTAEDLSTMTPESLDKLRVLIAEAQVIQDTHFKVKPSKALVLKAGESETGQEQITPEALEKLQIAVAQAHEIQVDLGRAKPSKAEVMKAGASQTVEDLATMTPEVLEKLQIAVVEAKESEDALGKARASKLQILKAGPLTADQDLSTMTPEATDGLIAEQLEAPQITSGEAKELLVRDESAKAVASNVQLLKSESASAAEALAVEPVLVLATSELAPQKANKASMDTTETEIVEELMTPVPVKTPKVGLHASKAETLKPEMLTEELKPEQVEPENAFEGLTKLSSDKKATITQIESKVGFQELDEAQETDIVSDESMSIGEDNAAELLSPDRATAQVMAALELADLDRETDLLSDSEGSDLIEPEAEKGQKPEAAEASGGAIKQVEAKIAAAAGAEEDLHSKKPESPKVKKLTQTSVELDKGNASESQLLTSGAVESKEDPSILSEALKMQELQSDKAKVLAAEGAPKSKAQVLKSATVEQQIDPAAKSEQLKSEKIPAEQAEELLSSDEILRRAKASKAQALKAGSVQTTEDLSTLTQEKPESQRTPTIEAKEVVDALSKAKISKAQVLKAGTLKTAQDLSTMTPEALEKMQLLVAEAQEVQVALSKAMPVKDKVLKAGTFGTTEDLTTLTPEVLKKLQITVAEAQEIQVDLGTASPSKVHVMKAGTSQTVEDLSSMTAEALETLQIAVVEAKGSQDTRGIAKTSKAQILKAGTLKTAQDLSTMAPEALAALKVLVAEAQEVQVTLSKAVPSKDKVLKAGTLGTTEDLTTLTPEALIKLQLTVAEAQDIQVTLGTASSSKAQILKAGTSQTVEALSSMTAEALETLQIAVVEAKGSQDTLGKAKTSKAQVLKAGTLKTAQDLSNMAPEALETLKVLVAEAQEVQVTLSKGKPSKAQVFKSEALEIAQDLVAPDALEKLKTAVAEAQAIQVTLGKAKPPKAQILNVGTSQTAEDLSTMTAEALAKLEIAVAEAKEPQVDFGRANASKAQILKAGTLKTAKDLSTMTPEALEKLQVLIAEAQEVLVTLIKAKPSKAQISKSGALETVQNLITPEALEKLQVAVTEAQEIQVVLGKVKPSEAGTLQTAVDLSIMTAEVLEKLEKAVAEAKEDQELLGTAMTSKAQALKSEVVQSIPKSAKQTEDLKTGQTTAEPTEPRSELDSKDLQYAEPKSAAAIPGFKSRKAEARTGSESTEAVEELEVQETKSAEPFVKATKDESLKLGEGQTQADSGTPASDKLTFVRPAKAQADGELTVGQDTFEEAKGAQVVAGFEDFDRETDLLSDSSTSEEYVDAKSQSLSKEIAKPAEVLRSIEPEALEPSISGKGNQQEESQKAKLSGTQDKTEESILEGRQAESKPFQRAADEATSSLQAAATDFKLPESGLKLAPEAAKPALQGAETDSKQPIQAAEPAQPPFQATEGDSKPRIQAAEAAKPPLQAAKTDSKPLVQAAEADSKLPLQTGIVDSRRPSQAANTESKQPLQAAEADEEPLDTEVADMLNKTMVQMTKLEEAARKIELESAELEKAQKAAKDELTKDGKVKTADRAKKLEKGKSIEEKKGGEADMLQKGKPKQEQTEGMPEQGKLSEDEKVGQASKQRPEEDKLKGQEKEEDRKKDKADPKKIDKEQTNKNKSEKQMFENAEKKKEEAGQAKLEKDKERKEKVDKDSIETEKEKSEKEKLEKEKKEKTEKEKLDKEKTEKERMEKAKKENLEKEKVEKEKAEKVKIEKAEKVKIEKAEKEKVEKDKAEKYKLEKEKLEKEKAEKEQVEKVRKEKLEKEKAETEKLEKEKKEKVEKDKLEKEKKEKAEKDKLDKDKAEKYKLEKEKREKAEKEKLEKEKAEKEQVEKVRKEKLEKEKAEKEKVEKVKKEKLEKEKAETEKLEKEKKEKVEKDKLEKEKLEKEKKEKAEKDKLDKEKSEKEKLDKEKKDKAEKEKLEKEKKEIAEKDKLEKEMKDKAEKEKLEKEKNEKAEKEKLEKEKNEKAEKEKLEKEKKEKAEKEKLEKEKKEKTEKEKLETEKKDKAEKEKLEKEKKEIAEKEKLEKEKKEIAEKDKLEKEMKDKAEQEKLEKEKKEKAEKEKLEKEKKEKAEKEKFEKEKKEKAEKEKLEKEKKDKAEKEKLEKEKKDKAEKEKLEKEKKDKAEKEKLEKEKKEKAEKEKLEKEKKEKAEKEKLEKEKSEKAEKEKLEKEKKEKAEKEKLEKEKKEKAESEKLEKEKKDKAEKEKLEKEKKEKAEKEKLETAKKTGKTDVEGKKVEKIQAVEEHKQTLDELKRGTGKPNKETAEVDTLDKDFTEARQHEREKTAQSQRKMDTEDTRETKAEATSYSEKYGAEETEQKFRKHSSETQSQGSESYQAKPERKRVETKSASQDYDTGSVRDTHKNGLEPYDLGTTQYNRCGPQSDSDSHPLPDSDSAYSSLERPEAVSRDRGGRHFDTTSYSISNHKPEPTPRVRRPADMNSFQRRYDEHTPFVPSRPPQDLDGDLARVPRVRHTPSQPQYTYDPDDARPIDHSANLYTSPRPQYTDHEAQLHRHRDQIRPLKGDRSSHYAAGPEPGQLSSDWSRDKARLEEAEESRQRSRLEALEKTRQSIDGMRRETERRTEEKRLKREAIMADFSVKMKRIEERTDDGMPSVLTVPSTGYSYFTDETCSSRDASKRPRFSLKLQERVISYTSNIKLTCNVLGTPPPQLQWYKNGLPINSDGLKVMITNNSGVTSLNIRDACKEDMAEYTCFARNMYGKAATSCILTVIGDQEKKPQPARFTRGLTESHFKDVDEMVLECSVGGYPLPDVMWLREGQVILPFGSYSVGRYVSAVTFDGRCRLFVQHPKESDSGIYTCIARNESWTEEAHIVVEVLGKPVPPPRHVARPEPPPYIPTIQERPRAGTPIVTSKAPYFLEHPEGVVTVTEGDDLGLSVRVGGDPKPRVNLYRGCRDVTLQARGFRETVGDSVRFTLRRVELMDAGRMTIEAKNLFGLERLSVSVKVLKGEGRRARSMTPALFAGGPDRPSSSDRRRHPSSGVPGKLSEPIASELGPGWVSLRWTRPESPAPILAYRVEAWDTSEGARWATLGMSPIPSFEAFHLRPGREYLFRVTPRNRFGWGEAATTQVPVCVRDKCEMPDFVKSLPSRVKVLRGSSLTLDCEVKGTPSPNIVWIRDGQELDESKPSITVRIESDCHLTVTAANSVGQSSSFCQVVAVDDPSVAEADLVLRTQSTSPQFTMRLRDRRVTLGHPLRLTCQVGGVGRIRTEWEKEGSGVSEDYHSFQDGNFHTLERSNVRMTEAGLYTVRASNEFGEVSCSCSVIVTTDFAVHPRWVKTLRNYVRVREGGLVVIEGQVEAYPGVTVKWYKDSSRLRSYNRRFRYELDRHGHVSLLIENASLKDAGKYAAVVENELGCVEGVCAVEVTAGDESTVLEVLENSTSAVPEDRLASMPRFLRKPLSMSVLEGDTAVIECSVEGWPKPEVLWLRDWLNPSYYKDRDHYELECDGETEFRLVIPCVKIDYTGSYTVVARNSHGSCKAIVSLQVGARIEEGSSSIQVGPTFKIPRVIQPLTDIRCCDGDSVTFLFRAEGEELTYIWEKDGKVISSKSPDFLVQGAQLTIPKVYGEDEGVYKCKISNDLGKAETSACLVVDAPLCDPTTSLEPSDEMAGAITLATNSCRRERQTTGGTPSPSTAHFHSPPKFFVLPHNKLANDGDNVRFQCSVSGATITTWERDGRVLCPNLRINTKELEDVRVLEILNVTLEDAGSYRITLENHAGRVVANVRLDIVGRSRGERMRAWSSSPVHDGRRDLWDPEAEEGKDICID